MYTLGINAAFHDSAACLVQDGRILAAAEEERFTRIKHGKRPVPFSAWELPYHAIAYCLAHAGITLPQVDHVAYAFDPSLLLGAHRDDATITLPLEPSAHETTWDSPWDPLFLSYIVNAPRQLAHGAPLHLRHHFRGAQHDGPFRWHFVPHHVAHAASAFLPSPFEEAAVMTLDGRGELATTAYFMGSGTCLEPLGEVRMPSSLGLLYEEVTSYLGFLHSSDEYKVMALASFGTPRYRDAFREIIEVRENGCYVTHPPRLEERFGPARLKSGPMEQHHYDIARSLQSALEDSVLELAHWLGQSTHATQLCLAGGVALNCVMNARIRDHGPFRDVWVQPAAGDAGTALGAALTVDAREHTTRAPCATMDHPYLGPSYSDDEIEPVLERAKLRYRRLDNVADEAAELLADGKILGWFQGR